MNIKTLKDQWNQLKSKAKSKWSQLTDSDISSIEGSGEKLTERVKARTGCSPEDAQRQVDQFCTDNNVATVHPTSSKLPVGATPPRAMSATTDKSTTTSSTSSKPATVTKPEVKPKEVGVGTPPNPQAQQTSEKKVK